MIINENLFFTEHTNISSVDIMKNSWSPVSNMSVSGFKESLDSGYDTDIIVCKLSQESLHTFLHR